MARVTRDAKTNLDSVLSCLQDKLKIGVLINYQDSVTIKIVKINCF